MRITYLHQYFVPPDGSGGTRSYEFARRLIANGHEVCMITSSAMLPVQFQSTMQAGRGQIAGIPAVVIQVPYSNSMDFNKRIRAFYRFAVLASIEARRHSADVIFATSTPLTIAIPGIIGKISQAIPLVFEVRDLWPEVPISVGALRNPMAKGLAQMLEWLAYHASTHIVALSPGMAEGIARRGITPEKITVIPNSCDLEWFDVPPSRGQPVRDRLNLTENQPLIVYTGTFGLINGVGYLVDIAAAMRAVAPEIRFLLVGSGAEEDKITAKAQAQQVLNENLWIWDSVPKAEVPDLLAAATVATSVVIPIQALWNNSANKFFDALAAGKPVAINYGGWQADLLTESGAGIVVPADDPMCAAQLLASFARDSQRLEQAAVASRTLAYSQFHRDILAHKLETVLHQAVHGGQSSYGRVSW